MHEVGLMQNLLDSILDQAGRQQFRRIHRVTLRVGDLSGVVPEALQLAFEVVTRGTIAESASLEVEQVAVVCRCRTCEREFRPPDVIYQCPHCGQLSAEVRQGRELELESLEVS